MVTKYQRPSKYAYDLLTGNVETAMQEMREILLTKYLHKSVELKVNAVLRTLEALYKELEEKSNTAD